MGGSGSDEGGGDSGGLSVVVLNKNITVEKREGGKYLGRPAKIAREQIKKKRNGYRKLRKLQLYISPFRGAG